MPENTRAMRGDARGGRRAPKNDNPLIILVSMPYEVQTPVFEGPFDLLLHLILQEQVDLYEVSLSTIVDSYLRELERLDELELDRASEFLLIAATLVELKSRRLLPTGDDLGVDERYVGLMPDLLEGVDADEVRRAYLRAVAPKPQVRIDLDHVAPIRASVTDAVAELVDELPRVGRITFRALTGDLVDRLEVVVRFLAILELFKNGLVNLDQPRTFGDIEITWLGAADAVGLVDPDGTLASIDTYDG